MYELTPEQREELIRVLKKAFEHDVDVFGKMHNDAVDALIMLQRLAPKATA